MSLIEEALKRRQEELRARLNMSEPPQPTEMNPPAGSFRPPPPSPIPEPAKKKRRASRKRRPWWMIIFPLMLATMVIVGLVYYFLVPSDPEADPVAPDGDGGPPPEIAGIQPPPSGLETDPPAGVTDVTPLPGTGDNPLVGISETVSNMVENVEHTRDPEEVSPPPPPPIEENRPPSVVELPLDGIPSEGTTVNTWPDMKIMGLLTGRDGQVAQVIIDSQILIPGRKYNDVTVLTVTAHYVELEYQGDVERFTVGENTGSR